MQAYKPTSSSQAPDSKAVDKDQKTTAEKLDLSSQPTFEHEVRKGITGVVGNLESIQDLLKGPKIDALGSANLAKPLVDDAKFSDELSTLIADIHTFNSEITKILDGAKEKAKDGTTAGAEEDVKAEARNVAQKCHVLSTRGEELYKVLNSYFSQLTITDNKTDEYLKGIIFSIRHLRGLIYPFLSETEQLAIKKSLFGELEPVVALAHGVRFMHTAQAKKKETAIEVKSAKDIDQVLIKAPLFFREVIINLLSNAIDFTAKGSVVIDFGWDKDRNLEVTVKDTGAGMSPETQTRLLSGELYCQGKDNDLKRTSTGLGIPTSKELVESKLGGKFTVVSEVGKGSTFTFTVAKAMLEIQAQVQHRPPSPKKTEELQGLKILLADDNRVNNSITKRMLESASAICVDVSNGAEAVEEYSKPNANIQVILMDMQMPVMDGVQAAKEIRTKMPNARIIALTGSNQSDISDSAKELFDGFLTKPIKPADLFKEIRRVLSLQPLVSNTPANSNAVFTVADAKEVIPASPITIPAVSPLIGSRRVVNTPQGPTAAGLVSKFGFLPTVTPLASPGQPDVPSPVFAAMPSPLSPPTPCG